MLTVPKVTRADNGTVFTCLMTWDELKTTANYTLQVSYGPDDHHTRIHGPDVLVTDGTKYFNFTCQATDVYPLPIYTWDGVTCHNSDTDTGLCVLKPQPPWDDGLKMQCTATSNTTSPSVGKTTLRLNLTYPPPKPPKIVGYKAGQVLKNGDNLHCLVSGGKPLVKEVNFSCSSDPPHEDQQDTTKGSLVESSLTIGAVDSSNYSMQCVCGATWEADEDLYSQTSSITVFVHNNDEGLAKKIPESCHQGNGNGQTHQTSSPDYEEVDELAIQECSIGTIVEHSSHVLSVSKSKAFSCENIACKISKSQKIFHSCSTGLDSEKRMEVFLTPGLGISPGKTTQLLADSNDGQYTEIDIHIEGESTMGNHLNNFTTDTGKDVYTL
ncbi:hypothetical protein C0Q70_12872 [Pomacea canaliculata]|uniref:Ig-like domain-containing protein n=1 Tax=Pomacea canaliculata TaxID=400727 RepID=A0A2T7P2R3_POMCA|nr:hypothetical protein C0Q70_12872 [Pomacea canaliculata]